jgi:hypothetical protein
VKERDYIVFKIKSTIGVGWLLTIQKKVFNYFHPWQFYKMIAKKVPSFENKF